MHLNAPILLLTILLSQSFYQLSTLEMSYISLQAGHVGLIDTTYRWKFPIPYILSDSLDLNAKGAVYQAFEMYRLKSCVDFKTLGRCCSHVGELQTGQVLYLGPGCDHKAVIEHELLHALGFYHTQSRMEHSFNKYDDILQHHRTESNVQLLYSTFENINICGMIQSSTDDADWVHLKSSPGAEDHTHNLGYTMHFDTSTGNAEQSALLESRILYPKWKIQGFPFPADEDKTWKIGHVPMQIGAKFHYAFQGVRGDPGNSEGGIFIDDIRLTETHCPAAVWCIQNFSSILETADYNTVLNSPCFYSPEGYGFGDYTGLYFHLASGDNDIVMQWPAVNRQPTIVVMDQDPDIKLRMSSALETNTNTKLIWDNPRNVGTFDPKKHVTASFTLIYLFHLIFSFTFQISFFIKCH
uniref:Metalloendopeptidase n=1 Tax=Cyprinus carpio TaxID=7962 RepID=A0A8C1V3A2_CYPCA